ncbi:hypothetical protein [Bradyrhizobium sp. UFLA05-112]|jgi:hypothetical protein
MTTKTLTKSEASEAEKKIEKLRELYADAPEIGRVALENLIKGMKAKAASGEKTSTAGRIGLQKGKISELTTLLPLLPGGAKRIRAVLDAGGNLQNADNVGTLHDMRYVFLDNDTKLLFVTTYDGDWDPYIDDFATIIPDDLDVVFANCEGWPGVRNPAVKDFIVKHQIPAHAWYVGNPNLSVKDTRRLERIGAAVDEFLDKIA